jgi:hypothetical protein
VSIEVRWLARELKEDIEKAATRFSPADKIAEHSKAYNERLNVHTSPPRQQKRQVRKSLRLTWRDYGELSALESFAFHLGKPAWKSKNLSTAMRRYTQTAR